MLVLIMGLPDSGKTTLATAVQDQLLSRCISLDWFNSDAVRTSYSDWDFSWQGRIRQADRMRGLAQNTRCQVAMIDMVAALEEQRRIIAADLTVWVATKTHSRFPDTDAVFQPPWYPDITVTTQDTSRWAPLVAQLIAQSLQNLHG